MNDKCGHREARGIVKGGEYFSANCKYSSEISHAGGERFMKMAGFVKLPSETRIRY